jgi:hypothetical protein
MDINCTLGELALSFVALSNSKDITAKADINIILEFISLFKSQINYETRQIQLECLQVNSTDLSQRIDEFCKKYASTNPIIYKIKDYFRSLDKDEYFLVMPITQEDKTDVYLYLSSLKDGVNFDKEKKMYDSLFKDLLQVYSLYAFDGTKRRKIGEKDKTKRICRFCKGKEPNVTFKQIAHAISEALGNKNIISLEECDDCNGKFGRGIEHDLILYLQIYRSFFSVNGKNSNNIHLKGANYEIKRDSSGVYHIDYKLETDSPSEEELNAPLLLKSTEMISLQNIYRSLAKYALSVIDRTQLCFFENTISWINGETSITVLPKIAVLVEYALFSEHPKIVLYQRRANNNKLPYCVCEFHFTCLTFVAIIPLSNQDNCDFTDIADYEDFWKAFKHYQNMEWKFVDFSDDVKRIFKMKINFTTNNNAAKNAD